MTQPIVLVTGGCGFIGSHLVDALVHRGFRVRILDNFSTGKLTNLSLPVRQQVQVLIGNVSDPETVEVAMQGCDYVFHLAAIASVAKSMSEPVSTGRVNYGGTLNVLQAAQRCQVQRVIYSGSAAVYGDEPTLPKQEAMPTCPISPYGVDKLASELMGHVYSQISGVEFVCLRYFNVFGPRQDATNPYSGVISIFCDRICRGISPHIYGDGLQSRDFVYISDVVEANLLAMEHPQAPGKTLNVGRGRATTLLEITAILSELTGNNCPPIHETARPGDIRHSLADNSALRALGWSPQISMHQGLQALIEEKLAELQSSCSVESISINPA